MNKSTRVNFVGQANVLCKPKGLPYILLASLSLLCVKEVKKPPEIEEVKISKEVEELSPLTALNYYQGLLKTVQDTSLRREIYKKLYEIYLDQKEYELAYDIFSNLQDSLKNLPIVFLSLKKYEEALSIPYFSPLTKAFCLEKLNRFQEATDYYDKSPPLLKDYASLRKAYCFYKLEDFEKSKELLEGILSLPQAKDLLIDILIKEKDEKEIKKYIARFPKSAKRLYLESLLDKRKGWKLIREYPKSSYALKAAKELKNSTPNDYYFLGKVYYSFNSQKAKKYLRKYLQRRPRGRYHNEARYMLAKIYLRESNTKSALSVLRRAYSAKCRYLEARILLKQGRGKEAVAKFRRLAAKFPKSSLAPSALFEIGLIFEGKEMMDSACAVYMKIAKKYQEERAFIRAGIILMNQEKFEEAEKVLKKGKEVESLYFLAKTEEKLGKSETADSLYKKIAQSFTYIGLRLRENPLLRRDAVEWISSWSDTTYLFNKSDSLRSERARIFAQAGLLEEVEREIKGIEQNNPLLLYKISEFCAEYGMDHYSILYAEKIKRKALKNQTEFPLEFLRLLYPSRYGASILNSNGETPWILSMMRQESWFNSKAKSPAGAMGLMQIMPSTGKAIAQTLGYKKFKTQDLLIPEVSIKFGIKYFVDMKDKFGSEVLALAAYNAGPLNVKRWLERYEEFDEESFINLIPFKETRGYVKKCLLGYFIYKEIFGEEKL